MAKLNHPNHALGDCFKPYNAFCSLQTTFHCIGEARPGGTSMYTSSSRSPWRKHFLRQIGAVVSPSLQQERSALAQYLISLPVRRFLDNLSHISEYIPSPPALLYIFLPTHLLCA